MAINDPPAAPAPDLATLQRQIGALQARVAALEAKRRSIPPGYAFSLPPTDVIWPTCKCGCQIIDGEAHCPFCGTEH